LLNPSPYRAIESRILAHTSILVLNRVEAAQMALALGRHGGGQHTHEQWAALSNELLGLGPDVVIVTLGAEGALAYRKGQKPVHQSAFPVEPVDSLGAGDAFSAGFAVSLVDEFPFVDCLRRAAACGAMATKKLGVFDALPSRAQVEAFLCM
jgi:ribokinase